jgi:diaminopimelate decarboxylase
MDVVSGGELFRALRAGCDPRKIVYAGVGKSVREIAEALRAGILMFNVESVEELAQIDRTAGELGLRAPVALRVNPAIDPLTHQYIATGLKESKFGIESGRILETYRAALGHAHLEVVGIHCHIGSQITQIGPFREAVEKIADLVRQVRGLGADLRYVDIGGGLGISYNQEEPPEPKHLSAEILPVLRELDATIITEPGRVIVGNAGALLTRVLYHKETSAKSFLVVDAGMNDLVRPSLYGSYHRIVPLAKTAGTRRTMDVVGPICESGDFLAKDRELPPVPPGECLAVLSAGAYGFAMSSNYNSRPRAAEVLVRGGAYAVIRPRESYEDLVRGEAPLATGAAAFRAPATR